MLGDSIAPQKTKEISVCVCLSLAIQQWLQIAIQKTARFEQQHKKESYNI